MLMWLTTVITKLIVKCPQNMKEKCAKFEQICLNKLLEWQMGDLMKTHTQREVKYHFMIK